VCNLVLLSKEPDATIEIGIRMLLTLLVIEVNDGTGNMAGLLLGFQVV
jgi:hypothetical protein